MRTFTGCCLGVLLLAGPVSAQSVVPLNGQSSQQMQTDMDYCNGVASNAASSAGTSSKAHVGGRVRGAAAGAAATGAIASAPRWKRSAGPTA